MFMMKRIFLNDKRLTCCICTSAVKNCEKPNAKDSRILDILLKKGEDSQKRNEKKKLEYPEVTVSPEEKQNAKDSLKKLLESMKFEGVQKEEEKDTSLREMLKMQVVKKKVRKQKKKNLEELAIEAAHNVAEEMGGNLEKTKQDLLNQLMAIDVTKEREVPEEIQKPEIQVKQETALENPLMAMVDFISSGRLGIFEKSMDPDEGSEVRLMIWDKLEQEELAYRATKPPRNQFEEWLRWTEQGRLWRFPIDNDQGREAEAAVDFTQHVFLDEHLEPWCPKKGPLKKFMDLVLVGLSKNPHLTLEEKKEHIFWYRDYFENKKQLLQELGAFGSAIEIGESENIKKNPQKS